MNEIITWKDVWEEFQVKGKEIIDLVEVYEPPTDLQANSPGENLPPRPTSASAGLSQAPNQPPPLFSVDDSPSDEPTSHQIVTQPFPNPLQLIAEKANQGFIDELTTEHVGSRLRNLQSTLDSLNASFLDTRPESICPNEPTILGEAVQHRLISSAEVPIGTYPAASKQVHRAVSNLITLEECSGLIDSLMSTLRGVDKVVDHPSTSIACELKMIAERLIAYGDEDRLIVKSNSLQALLKAYKESSRLTEIISKPHVHKTVFSATKLDQQCEDNRIDSMFSEIGRFRDDIFMASDKLEDVNITSDEVQECVDLNADLTEIFNRVTMTDQLLSSAIKQLNLVDKMVADQTDFITNNLKI